MHACIAPERAASDQQRRPKRRRRKPGLSPTPSAAEATSSTAGVREAAARGCARENGTASTRSGSPSSAAAAGATQMLQLAVGRSPARARRPVPSACLTDASLAAFDLSPDLDNTATTSAAVRPSDLLDPTTAEFSLPPFDLQTWPWPSSSSVRIVS